MDYKKCGLKIFCKKKLLTSMLCCQYSPETIDKSLWNSTKMSDSPHVVFLQNYIQNKEIPLSSSYALMHKKWNEIGNFRGGKKRNNQFIKSKMKKFVRLFHSIKKKGCLKPITVLGDSFWRSRFGGKLEYDFDGYEIWDGHHRAACCYVLGVKKIKCIVLTDCYPMKGVKYIG